MMKRVLAILVSALLLMGMLAVPAFAAGEEIAYWNATTTMFYAELTGAPAGDLTVSVGDNTNVAATRGASGDKTTVTANLTTPLALDTWYTAQISAGGAAVASVEFQLAKLWTDNFDYTDDEAIRAVYASNDSQKIKVDAIDGKMRLRYAAGGAVYHKDFLTEQASWSNYTMEYDFYGGSDGTSITADGETVTYNAAKNLWQGLEADKSTDYGTVSPYNTRLQNVASLCLNANSSFSYQGRRTDGKDAEKGITAAAKIANPHIAVQLSTKGDRFMGRLDETDFMRTLESSPVRGGGFTFVSRSEGEPSIPSYFLIDNLKVYRPEEKGVVKTYTLSLVNATTRVVRATLSDLPTGTLTASIDGAEAAIKNSGAAVTVTPAADLTLDSTHVLTVSEGGEPIATLSFRLEHLLVDDFDSYNDTDNPLRGVYKDGDTNTIAGQLEDGKLRCRSVGAANAVYHKDYAAVQADWRDYTLECDYSVGADGNTAVAGNAAYDRPNYVRIAIETSMPMVEKTNEKGKYMGFDFANRDAGLKYAAATLMPESTKMRLWIGKGNGEQGLYDSSTAGGANYTSKENLKLQVGIRNNTLMALVGNQIVYEGALPSGTTRGGGFMFITQKDTNNTYFYIDNLKVYKANEVEPAVTFSGKDVAFAAVGGKISVTGTAMAANPTSADKPIVLIAACYDAQNRMTGLQVLDTAATIAAGESVSGAISIASDSADTSKVQIYAFDSLTGLKPYDKQITVIKE